MELLQNRRYKAGEIPDSFFNEIKMQIEIIIEVCQEGNISVHEAENILHTEILCSMDYQSELWEKNV
jgi:predicted HTH domain antitoxin